jgi:hypothetical protein
MVWFSFALLILGLYAARILHRHLHEKKLLGLREMVHTERMAALDRDRPWPESAIPEVESALSRSPDSRTSSFGPDHAALRWVRCTALAIGLAGLFGGIGTMASLYLVPDADVQGTWPLGMIPVFLGLGMLLFVRISRRMAETPPSEQETP